MMNVLTQSNIRWHCQKLDREELLNVIEDMAQEIETYKQEIKTLKNKTNTKEVLSQENCIMCQNNCDLYCAFLHRTLTEEEIKTKPCVTEKETDGFEAVFSEFEILTIEATLKK